jgi:hypothetical protein
MFDGLTPSAIDEQIDAAIKLADKTKLWLFPWCKLFLKA